MSADPRTEAAAIAIAKVFDKAAGPDHVRKPMPLDYDAARAAIAAIDKAATITTVEELDALPEGAVALGWAVQGRTPYLRCRTARGRLAWGCVGEEAIYESADLLKSDTPAQVIHWGTE